MNRFRALIALTVTVAAAAACAPMGARGARPTAFAGLRQDDIPTQPGEMPTLPSRHNPAVSTLARTGGGPQDLAGYEALVGRAVDRIEAAVRTDIDRGVLALDALDQVAAARGTIAAVMRVASADGVLNAQERAQLETLVGDLASETRQSAAVPAAWPGGARYWR